MSELLLATTNPGKQRELRRLLAAVPARMVTPREIGLELDVPEPHRTYAENARAKALAYCAASGRLTVADDSGLEVAALDWGPGVDTAHYGGREVIDKVGHLLEAVGDATDRRARMVCCVALGIPNGIEPSVELFTGVVDGEVAREPAGEGGFGYDPIFLLPEGVTTAQLPEGAKDRISHRGQAVAAAVPRIRELLGTAARRVAP